MSGNSPPLTPADCDLQDFPFMPIDVARLRDSGLASDETPEACWAAVLLWAASWHQVPAASMPNNAAWIAKAAGYAQRGKISEDWDAVRDGAMRNWVLCDDGRWYHPVVAAKARDAWDAKLQQRWRTEMARIKKHNDRHPGANVPRPSLEQWLSSGRPSGQPLHVPEDTDASLTGLPGNVAGDTPDEGGGHAADVPGADAGRPANVPGETASKGQREGQGQGQGDSVLDKAGADGAPPTAPTLVAPKPGSKPRKPLTPEEQVKSEVWKAAVSVLEEGGCPPSQCRTFMGKLVGDYSFPIVRQAVEAAVSAQPADAREYLKATCQRLKGERHNSQQALEQRGADVASAWVAGGRHA